ncbi:MAG TPA: hypothetical protein VGD67_08250 [Pseudonocardiaceae bacterium]
MSSMVSLEDFSQRRREELLLRYATELDYDGVQDLVTEAAGGQCWRRESNDRVMLDAVLGEDQLFHLRQNGRTVLCRGRPPRRPVESPPLPPLPDAAIVHLGEILNLCQPAGQFGFGPLQPDDEVTYVA